MLRAWTDGPLAPERKEFCFNGGGHFSYSGSGFICLNYQTLTWRTYMQPLPWYRGLGTYPAGTTVQASSMLADGRSVTEAFGLDATIKWYKLEEQVELYFNPQMYPAEAYFDRLGEIRDDNGTLSGYQPLTGVPLQGINPSHNYDGWAYHPGTDSFWLFGGISFWRSWANGNRGERDPRLGDAGGDSVFEFRPDEQAYYYRGAIPTLNKSLCGNAAKAEYDAGSELIVVTCLKGSFLFDPRNPTVTQELIDSGEPFYPRQGDMIGGVIRPGHIRFAGPPMSHNKSGDGTMTVIPEQRLVVIIDRASMRVWKIRQNAAGEAWLEDLGTPFSKNNAASPPWWPSFKAGSGFDGERFVMWNGGRPIWTARPASWSAADLARADNWTIELYPNPQGPASNAKSGRSAGVFGKFHYLADYGVFVGYNNYREGAWFYKLPDVPQIDPRRTALEAEGFTCADGVEAWGCPSLQRAIKATPAGGVLQLRKGLYRQCARITRKIRLDGNGSILEGAVCGKKGALLLVGQADGSVIENLECRNITNGRNAACIRRGVANLTLRNVYFHDSDNGIQGTLPKWKDGGITGTILIEDSRFLRLGLGGRAHGVYAALTDRLIIRRSHFLCSKDQGHEIKSGARVLIIEDSVIDSQDCEDSRLIDAYNGGEVIIRRSRLVQGPRSSNWDLIGFNNAQRVKWTRHRLEVVDSTIECQSKGRLIHGKPPMPAEVVWRNNKVIGDCEAIPN